MVGGGWGARANSEFKMKIIQSVIDCLTPSAGQSADLRDVRSKQANKQTNRKEGEDALTGDALKIST